MEISIQAFFLRKGRTLIHDLKSSLLDLTDNMSDNMSLDHDILHNLLPHHLYGARVLISLLAHTAPLFAEECWSVLRYGPRSLETFEGIKFTLADSILSEQFPVRPSGE